MSGGSWDYAFTKLEDIASRLRSEQCSYRRALAELIDKVAKALHDIEWVDSCDYGKGDDIEAIKIALGGRKFAEQAVLDAAIKRAEEIRSELDKAIERATNV